jgi:hypothetical protein
MALNGLQCWLLIHALHLSCGQRLSVSPCRESRGDLPSAGPFAAPKFYKVVRWSCRAGRSLLHPVVLVIADNRAYTTDAWRCYYLKVKTALNAARFFRIPCRIAAEHDEAARATLSRSSAMRCSGVAMAANDGRPTGPARGHAWVQSRFGYGANALILFSHRRMLFPA